MRPLIVTAMLLASPALAQEAPSAAQVLDAYIKALGGADKLKAVTTRVMRGTLENSDDGSVSKLEVQAKAPHFYSVTATAPDQGPARTVFAGDAGWSLDPDSGVRAMTRDQLAAARRDYDFYRDLHLAEFYPKTAAPRKARLAEKDAWVIETEAPGGEPEKLWFDAASGLLLSREYQRMTLEDGIINYQEFYEDYKDVEGIQVPRKIRRATPDYELTYQFTSIQLNAPVQDAAFAKPSK